MLLKRVEQWIAKLCRKCFVVLNMKGTVDRLNYCSLYLS